MNQLVRFGFILGIICLLATFVLALTYEVTKPKIDEQLRIEEKESLEIIMPGADSFEEKSIDGIEYFEALNKDKEFMGYCIRVVGNGYNGYIRMLVGIDAAGVIKGVEILEQYETPGLGANIDQTRPGEKEPYFLRQFKGKQARTVTVKKDIDAITGATISSKAVSDAINKTTSEFLAKVKR